MRARITADIDLKEPRPLDQVAVAIAAALAADGFATRNIEGARVISVTLDVPLGSDDQPAKVA